MKSAKPQRLSGKGGYKVIEPYIWILPSIILMTIFIIPIGYVFYMSVSEISKAGLVKGEVPPLP